KPIATSGGYHDSSATTSVFHEHVSGLHKRPWKEPMKHPPRRRGIRRAFGMLKPSIQPGPFIGRIRQRMRKSEIYRGMAQSPHIHSQQTGCDGPNFQGLRRLLYEPPDGSEVCTHTETLANMSRLAREG